MSFIFRHDREQPSERRTPGGGDKNEHGYFLDPAGSPARKYTIMTYGDNVCDSSSSDQNRETCPFNDPDGDLRVFYFSTNRESTILDPRSNSTTGTTYRLGDATNDNASKMTRERIVPFNDNLDIMGHEFCKFKTGFTESQKADSARADGPGILTFFS